MVVINTNYKALFGQAALKSSDRALSTAMQQLSTGKRINSAKDDAAGMAISTRMTQQIRALNQAVRNAGDAVSLIQTVEGATNSITDMMQRMRELAVQAVNDTNANDQRSYLDLEFQQLKKEIVRISDMTEWNGFQILNGSVGERVGERPVYKATSVSDTNTVFIDPTTSRTVGGATAGEQQTISFSADATADGSVTFDGVTVSFSSGDTSTAIADSLAAALSGSTFSANSGRSISSSGGVVTMSYAASEGNVDEGTVTATGVSVLTAAEETLPAISDTTETIAAPGAFLKSGALSFSTDGSTVTASFLANDGVTTTMDGSVDPTTGKVTFLATAGTDNATVISGDLSYVFKDVNGAVADLTSRTATLSVDVSGSIPALKSGDLLINGVNIGASYASDDKVSPRNNAGGSSIAIAAAINSKSAQTGVTAVVNPNEMHGSAMSGASVVSGDLTINGFSIPRITTVLNNARESRAATVAAINFMTAKTGVKAIDTQNDAQGVRLVAEDGRNIEVTFQNLTSSDTDFSARTGLRYGVQSGTYSLESKVEQGIKLTSTATGDVARARLTTTNFADNISSQVMGSRAEVTDSSAIKTLKEGDLVINGIAVPGSRTIDDKASSTISDTSAAAGSAISIAAAINRVADVTGVKATAVGAEATGNTTVRGAGTGMQSLFINGVDVSVNFSAGSTAGERVDEVVSKVNALTGSHGVVAEKTQTGALSLKTVDGRNLSVWFDSTLTADNFGLGLDGSTPVAGVSSVDTATATSNTASTVYGRVELSSPTEFTVTPGVNGYKDESNFTALGFQEGSFGGVVNDADGKMSPPRTGRLAFQVGATAGQLITIDLADFGKGGPITGSITSDVDSPGTVTTTANMTTTHLTAGTQSLYVNGVEVKVDFAIDLTSSKTAEVQRREAVVSALNAARADTGVTATDNGYGISLSTGESGRNLSLWFDSSKVPDANEFGLGGADGVTGEPGATITFNSAKVLYPDTNNIRSAAGATSVLVKLDRAMDKVNANRANMGAVMNRLQYAMDNLSNVSMNSSASRSQIEDADYAAASTEMAKNQIMQQAATAVLAQANSSMQSVLKLLG